jgi:hypothetical protein
MLVRLSGHRERFNGEFVRLLSVEGVYPAYGLLWRVEPLFPLPPHVKPVCGEKYLRRIDPEGREVRSWNDSIWKPAAIRIRESVSRNPFGERV